MATSAPEPRPKLVCASILYWQRRELPLIERAIESLLAQELGLGIRLEILVVDNGCGSVPALAGEHSVDLVRLAENAGFSGGHNAAMRLALSRGADYVLLFNSDAIAEPGCVRELVGAAEEHPAAAFAGPVILRAAAPEIIESAGQVFNPRTGRHRELGRGQLLSGIDECPSEVDAISGCALLARRAAVESIGLLDEGLFAYFEDMEWCLRARRAGHSVLVVPAARVLHAGQGSTGGSSLLTTFYSVRNHMVVASRYGGPMPGPVLMVLALMYQAVFLATRRERRSLMHLAALAEGAVAAWTGRLGVRPSGAMRH